MRPTAIRSRFQWSTALEAEAAFGCLVIPRASATEPGEFRFLTGQTVTSGVDADSARSAAHKW